MTERSPERRCRLGADSGRLELSTRAEQGDVFTYTNGASDSAGAISSCAGLAPAALSVREMSFLGSWASDYPISLDRIAGGAVRLDK